MDRWNGIERLYTEEDVERLRGTIRVEHTLARLGAERLWQLLQDEDYVAALGAMTGGQAVQMVKAGLKAIYLSGLAGRRRREPRRAGLPGPEPLPGDERAGARVAASTTRCGAPTRSRLPRARPAVTGSRRSSPTRRRASAGR